jgi:hypothetical protein
MDHGPLRRSGRDQTMMHSFAPSIVALATAFGASLGHAKVRIGLRPPKSTSRRAPPGRLRAPRSPATRSTRPLGNPLTLNAPACCAARRRASTQFAATPGRLMSTFLSSNPFRLHPPSSTQPIAPRANIASKMTANVAAPDMSSCAVPGLEALTSRLGHYRATEVCGSCDLSSFRRSTGGVSYPATIWIRPPAPAGPSPGSHRTAWLSCEC